MNYLKRIVNEPLWVGSVVLRHWLSPMIKNDETYLKWEYFFGMGKFPDLKNPRTYNEKLQWLKLNDRNPLYTRMVDKAESKEYVAEILGSDEYNIPTLGVWDSFEDIDFDKLPDKFVLKTTHDSGGVVICKDKSKLDIKKARQKLEKSGTPAKACVLLSKDKRYSVEEKLDIGHAPNTAPEAFNLCI